MMDDQEKIDHRLWWLTNADFDGTISENEMLELESLLDSDPSALAFYVEFLTLNADILWLISAKQHGIEAINRQVDEAPGTAPSGRNPVLVFLEDWTSFFNQHLPLSYVCLFVVLGMTIFASSFWLRSTPTGVAMVESQFTAQITYVRDCQWSATMPAMAEKEELLVGQQLQFDKGLVQVTYSNGAVVLLEGPACFTVDSPKSGLLSRGKLTVRADTEKSRQFTILTPDARFVDLGTEFGVMIDDKGRSQVAVFVGKVNAAAKLANDGWDTPIILGQGEALVCEGRKFTRVAVQLSSFPSLQPPRPPVDASFQRWLNASRDLQNRRDLLAYYDFQPDPDNPKILRNRALTGAALDGKIEDAAWVEGRFLGKGALQFDESKNGVKVELPQEMPAVTLVAWVSIESLQRRHSSLLASDGWQKPFATHWRVNQDGLLVLAIQDQTGGLRSGVGDGVTTRPGEWVYPNDHFKRWCMLVTVYDSANRRLIHCFNGEQVETKALDESPNVNFGPAMIGGWNPDGEPVVLPRTLDGRMDEFMIFRKALTAEEIKQIYEDGKPDDASAPQVPSP